MARRRATADDDPPVRRRGRAGRGRGGRGAGRRRWVRWVLYLALVVAAVRVIAYRAYLVPSRAMEDTLLDGDYVLVETVSCGATVPFTHWRLPGLGRIRAGDVVVFLQPNDPQQRLYVKRCLALPGQTVEIRDKRVYVDGEPCAEPMGVKHTDGRVLPVTNGPRDNLGPRPVPAGSLFVMGDNRDNSRDSRHWGFLDEDRVVGTATRVYWSCLPDTAGGSWTAVWSSLISLPGRIRWGRIGHPVG